MAIETRILSDGVHFRAQGRQPERMDNAWLDIDEDCRPNFERQLCHRRESAEVRVEIFIKLYGPDEDWHVCPEPEAATPLEGMM